ncbi:LL-diaminopimelate aminotransferase [Scopulibacillus darangshiensis]|uniref:Aminotransferase n=1 Tax=Scopulibacillus darangshiensis TaxID=442528 RepID=A0A4R2NZQ4_9BACL|nr:LL-diaminopimelate aminotransferase [Scopulibacillus darangshiensis]TCP27031.1 LL-diaminopimelate aminotransferase [Scopulibacillus darangshiensis]
MKAVPSQIVKELPPYLFSGLNRKKAALRKSGIDLIDLGIGDPDLPTPAFIVDKLIKELKHPQNMRYSTFNGCPEYREAVADFYLKQYNTKLNPEQEVMTLIGSKEGIANLVQAMIDPGDIVLIPDPSYPVYRMAVHLAGGVAHPMPLLPEKGFVPDFTAIPTNVLKRAKLSFLNYPGNPTGACVDLDFFEEAVHFFKKHGIYLAHDSAYNLVTYGNYKAPSILEVPDANSIAVEFGSLSKAFNMTGFRIGYVVGNEEIVQTLHTVKSNLDSCQFLPIQKAAAAALTSDLSLLNDRNSIYEKRGRVMTNALEALGIKAQVPKGSIFLWAPVPDGLTSAAFCEKVMDETGVVVTPGTAFGEHGEGYFRISLSVPDDRLIEAAERMKNVSFKV